MCGALSAEFLLTPGNFESSLASDEVLAHYFNDFLSLPCFTEDLLYNQLTGQFEVASGAAESVSRRIRSVLRQNKSRLLTGDPTFRTRSPSVDNHYTVCCLDREQGIQWIKRHRLPCFLQSDCYFEYRLAKLLLQWETNFTLQRWKSTSSRSTRSAPPLRRSSQFRGRDGALTGLHFQEDISAKQGLLRINSVTCLPSGRGSTYHSRCSEPENVYTSTSLSSSRLSSSNYKCDKTHESAQTEVTLCSTGLSADLRVEQNLKESSSQIFDSLEQQLEYVAAEVVKQVLKDTVEVMDGQSLANTSACFSQPGDQTDCASEKDRERLECNKEKGQDGRKAEWDKTSGELHGRATHQENVCEICCYGACCHGNRPGLDEFREFLRGTPGEKLLNLWMDIERLKATRCRERKTRCLVLMRSCYLLSSSHSSLNEQLLSRLGLTTSPCWTEEKLCSIQPCLIDSLVYYWIPRFWTSPCVQEDHRDDELCTEWCPSRRISCQGSTALPLLHPNTCSPYSSHTVQTQSLCSRGLLLCSPRMERMIQALYADSRAGLYVTQFCERSGNQLWVNAVYCWTDLQHYHQLFYQDGLDPYRVQREAQLLYSTYLCSSAVRSVGVDEVIRREVYDGLMPAFEELFDGVEEHTLNILLEPWTLMVNRDKESFQQMCVQEEVRCINSPEYQELQSLYEESERQLKRMEQSISMSLSSSVTPASSLSKDPRASVSWSRVSPNYQGYRLGSLFRHRHEIEHFMSFLQNEEASVHLTCWLDLERYRRIPQKDKAGRREKSSQIATKYLNRKYFFGPDSPATEDQQNDILRLAGGLERLKLDCLSNPVVMEIQDIVRSHIESEWLPLFLSTAEFTERQKHRPKLQAADRLSRHVYRRRRVRREAWKAEGLWMSSSKEILLFRRILLNPVICQQFQHFVSLKGDFLENDVLFWLEVQRYKDLCHSHSDEATIQHKISTIISCFINSSMPPALQIDIPPEQAQHIMEKRHQLGPYIFREAQMSVFGELLKFWPEFQELASSVQEENLLPLLQEKRLKHRARVWRQRRKEEEEEEDERRAQEELERLESDIEEEDGTEEDDDDEAEEEEQEERSEKKQSRIQIRTPMTPTQSLSWSYSKYMAGLKREEVLLRRRSQIEASFSTVSDSSSDCSVMSASSKKSYRQPSHHSSRMDGKAVKQM
ncbi:regulator of G-protein signaling 22 [Parambassis ranga]|uniref:Regulator of G-protein signaling 22 n=1 Tax=Parambassis ranga TaxID=210632 RepID=A0A6P7JWH9_9TELE|nr:regulator of G-protein signaling 22 [Parambassis ranga]